MKTAVWYTSTFVVVFVYLYVYLIQYIRGAEIRPAALPLRAPASSPSIWTSKIAAAQQPPPSLTQQNVIAPPPPLDFNYHDYERMTDWMKHMSAAYPTLTALYSIGKSVQGRDLWVMVVSVSPFQHMKGKPDVKYVANIHGNEAVSREMALHLIEYLVKNYNEDHYVRWLLDNTRIHILPSLNPDGFEVAREGTCQGGQGRYNGRGFDLNRNFPDYFKQNTKRLQPETEAYKEWIAKIQFTLSAGLHGGALVASYPFDNTPNSVYQAFSSTPSLTPDDDVFQHLATTYAQNHPSMHLGLPCKPGSPSFLNGTTNGAGWYPLTGGAQDYSYVWAGTMEITVEMSCCKYPPAAELPGHWNDHRQPLVTFLGEAHRGVRGFVFDANGRPLENVAMKIKGRDAPFQTTKHGEYWRILLPGYYRIEAYKDGFEPVEEQVQVLDNRVAEINMTLFKVFDANGDGFNGAPSSAQSSLQSNAIAAKQDAPIGIGLGGLLGTIRSQLDNIKNLFG